MLRSVAALTFVLTLAVLVGPAWGADPATPPTTPDTMRVEVPVVTVTAPRPSARPGGASVVQVAMDSTAAGPSPTLDQVLRTMPLVVVRANSRGEVQPALRGGEDRQIAVIVDGVPITVGWDHRTDLSIVPLASARRVALVRGLSSLLTGPNVIAGAVEVDVVRGGDREPRRPPFLIDAGADQTGYYSMAGSGTMVRDAGDGEWLIRAGGGYRSRDGVALAGAFDGSDPATHDRLTADGDLRRNSDADGIDGFLAARRVWGSGAWTSLSASALKTERGVPPEAHLTDPRLWRYPFQTRGLAALSAGTGMRQTPWGRGDLEASLGVDAGRTEIDTYDDLDYTSVTGGEDGDDRNWTARLLGDHTLGNRGDLRTAFTFADARHDETLDGVSARYRQRLWSLAGETDWRFGTSVPFRVSAGVAADGSDTPESGDKPALDPLWDWGGRLGATAVFQGGLQAHGSVSRRARFPSLRELYSGALGRFLANPDLRPETVTSGELGLTARKGGAEVQAVGFHQVIDDAITRVTVSTPSGNLLQRVNLGAVRATGVEFVASASMRAIEAGADLTYQDVNGEDASGADQPLEYEAKVSGAARIELPVIAGVRLGTEVAFIGEQQGLNADTGAYDRIPATATLGFALTRAFPLAMAPFGRLDATLALDNLFDAAAFDQLGLPQPGRTLRFQMRLW